AYPEVPAYPMGVSAGLGEVALLHARREEWSEAIENYDKSISLLKKSLEKGTNNANYGDTLRDLLGGRAKAFVHKGDHEAASVAAEEIPVEAVPGTVQGRGKAAIEAFRVLSACVRLARKDDRLEPERYRELVERYLVRARAMLDAAERIGWNDPIVLYQLGFVL